MNLANTIRSRQPKAGKVKGKRGKKPSFRMSNVSIKTRENRNLKKIQGLGRPEMDFHDWRTKGIGIRTRITHRCNHQIAPSKSKMNKGETDKERGRRRNKVASGRGNKVAQTGSSIRRRHNKGYASGHYLNYAKPYRRSNGESPNPWQTKTIG